MSDIKKNKRKLITSIESSIQIHQAMITTDVWSDIAKMNDEDCITRIDEIESLRRLKQAIDEDEAPGSLAQLRKQYGKRKK